VRERPTKVDESLDEGRMTLPQKKPCEQGTDGSSPRHLKSYPLKACDESNPAVSPCLLCSAGFKGSPDMGAFLPSLKQAFTITDEKRPILSMQGPLINKILSFPLSSHCI